MRVYGEERTIFSQMKRPQEAFVVSEQILCAGCNMMHSHKFMKGAQRLSHGAGAKVTFPRKLE
jgi:hypothetical protein